MRELIDGEVLLLENLRVHKAEKKPQDDTFAKQLAAHGDVYVNDAFAAAHRNAPSMVAFQELLPTAGGRLLIDEVTALSGLASDPKRPCVFLLGGLKISDAFSMMEKVLADGTADRILTTGITANVMLIARGVDLGEPTAAFIDDRSLDAFIPRAAELLEVYGDRIEVPTDLAYDEDGERREIAVAELPTDHLLIDVGSETVAAYEAVIADAATLFVNGPAGVYESATGEYGTRSLWEAVAASSGYSVIGGGDTVASARRFVDPGDIGFISTGGGALIRFLSGQPLPLIEAMEKAAERDT